MLRKGLLLLLVLAMTAGVLAGCTKPTVQEPDEPKVLYLPSVRPGCHCQHSCGQPGCR